MRIGLVEFFLILLIASVTVGPNIALWVDRWMRRAQRTSAAASRRKAQMQAQAIAEREYLLHRFQVTGRIFAGAALIGLVYALFFRPIEAAPRVYTAPETPAAVQAGEPTEEGLALSGYENVTCIRRKEDWLYLSARAAGNKKKTESALLRMREDGSGLNVLLTAEGEITGFDFDSEGDLWLTVLTAEGGALCRAGHDGWGATLEQVVTQIDGRALTSLSAVSVGPDDRVYFAESAQTSAKNGLEAALRTELLAHTATGSIYVYDPAARSVERVMGGVAGAAGLALSPAGEILYISDLGSRCVWAVSPDSRELTAGGKNCGVFAKALSGYPGALAVDEEGEVYIGFRWARCSWLEDHADGTLLRGAALRLSQNMQEGLFRLSAGDCAVQRYSPDGALLGAFSGEKLGSTAAVCPAGSKVYLSGPETAQLRLARV